MAKNLWPKKQPLPKGSVVVGHVYLRLVLPPDGSKPKVQSQWEGDYHQLFGVLLEGILHVAVEETDIFKGGSE